MRKVLFFVLILISATGVFAQNVANTGRTNFDLTEYGVRVEPDKRLITVMASLEAAGIETPLTAKGAKFRASVQSDLQNLNPELRQKIIVFIDRYTNRFAERYQQDLSAEEKKEFSEFIKKYKQGFQNDAERKTLTEKYRNFFNALVSPFISMAYSLGPVPDLTDPARTTDLPGDLLEVLDYAPLVREFYRRMTGAKIEEYAKTYQSEDKQLRDSAVEMVSELLNYLHTKPQLSVIERLKTQTPSGKNKKKTLVKTEIRERSRRFFIVPEMLAPKGTVNFLNIGDDYFAVVPEETDLSQSEVRRAYLQFVVDPLVLTNAKDISTVSAGIKTLLAERRKENASVSPDAFLAVSRSLVAAVDAREIEYQKSRIATAQARRNIDLMKTDGEKRKVSAELETYKKSLADETALQLSEAYERGAVLSFYFAEQLKGLEDSGFDIASSFRDMILSLDTTKETPRLTQFAEARSRALAARAARKSSGASETIVTVQNPLTTKLLDIEKIIQSKNFLQAETELKRLLEQNPSDAPRLYYTLGRVASLSAEPIADVEARNRRLLDAKVAYENVIRTATPATDRALLSLSYVALARLYEYDSEPDYAVKLYEAAIKIGDVKEGAYKEAIAARERLLQSKK